LQDPKDYLKWYFWFENIPSGNPDRIVKNWTVDKNVDFEIFRENRLSGEDASKHLNLGQGCQMVCIFSDQKSQNG
jgi:hypothetical protein